MKPRWLFFALFASYSLPGRFTSIFYQQHHLDEAQIGIIMASSRLVNMFSAPFFCTLADRIGMRERVTFITYAACLVSFFAQIIAMPSLNILSPSNRFFYLVFTRFLFSAFSSASYPLVSAITISQLKSQFGHKGHERFGHERLWGAVSWATCSFLLGALLDLVSSEIWLIHFGCLLMGILFLVTLHRFENQTAILDDTTESESFMATARVSSDIENESSSRESDDTNSQTETTAVAQPSASTGLNIRRFLCSDGIAAPVFFNLIFWLSAGMSLVESLLFLFFQNELHASNLLCGISVIVTVVFEIPIFSKAPELLDKLGTSILAIIGSASFSIRGIGYSLSPNGWVALLNEPLHGITYGAFHTATVAYIAERMPPELEATGQSVLKTLQSLGQILGTSAGGYVMERFGSKILYKGAGLVVLGATIAFGIVDYLSQRKHAVETCALSEDDSETHLVDSDTILSAASD